MSRTPKEALIDKIRKLQALGSEANPSDNERLQALQKVSKLLSEHNLELSDLTDTDNEVGVRITDYLACPWLKQLCSAVAKLYYCESLTPVGSDEMCYLGTKENTIVAAMMTDYLANSIGREAMTQYTFDESLRDSFCIGAATTILTRVEYILIQERQPPAPIIWTPTAQKRENELVLVRNKLQEANAKYLEEQNIEIPTDKAEVSVNHFAFSHGAQYGNLLGLEKQLGKREAKRIEKDE